MAPDPIPFNPDWTIAPAVTLEKWMRVKGATPESLAAVAAEYTLAMIADVLNRAPLTEDHAIVLSGATAIPVQFWLDLERGYRADLEAGRKDVTKENPDGS